MSDIPSHLVHVKKISHNQPCSWLCIPVRDSSYISGSLLVRSHFGIICGEALDSLARHTGEMAPKAARKSVIKGAGGVRAKAKPSRASGATQALEKSRVTQQTSDAMKQVRAKIAAKRKEQSEDKVVQKGFGRLGGVCLSRDMKFIEQWFEQGRMHIVPYVCSLMRNGLLESSYNEQHQVKSSAPLTLGKRLLTDNYPNGPRWRNLSASKCVGLVAAILHDPEIVTWFRGDAKLDINIAHKALMMMLATTSAGPMPRNHQYSDFEYPLLWVCRRQWEAVGKRLQNISRDEFDKKSDYFTLADDMDKVCCNANGSELKLPVALTIATDWVIEDAHSFEGRACSRRALAWTFALRL